MKILVVGYGSIGRVHAANARALGEVAVCDGSAQARESARADEVEPVFDSLDRALGWSPDGAVVATPPDTHIALACRIMEAGAAVLIEKPLAHDLAEFGNIGQTAGSAYVVCNMRFHPAVAEMTARLAEIGAPRFARAHYGHYLPQMRPGADYRTLYAGQRSAGGGVVRDAIHEIDYLMSWFGPVSDVVCSASRLSNLDIDVEDFSTLVLSHRCGVRSEIHLDYLRRRKARGCEVCGDDASLIWESDGRDPEDCRVLRVDGNGRAPDTLFQDSDLDASVMYRRLMEEFAAAIEGRSTALATLEEGAAALAVALAALQSAEQGRRVTLEKAAA